MFRIVISLTLVIAGLFQIGSPEIASTSPVTETVEIAEPEPAPAPAPQLTVDIVDPEWFELVDWALGRYEEVGLERPVGLITRSTDPAYCGGHSGQYLPGEVPEVRFCVDGDATSKVSRLIVLHELGHLWAEGRVDEAGRSEFLETRGLTAWIDSDQPRHEWGAEHAAEVLSWGLMDEPVRIIRIYNATPEALGEAFRVLTGSDPLVEA